MERDSKREMGLFGETFAKATGYALAVVTVALVMAVPTALVIWIVRVILGLDS